MASRSRSISLYRGLLRAGRSFPDYNVREFVIRRTKEDFRRNAALSGPAADAAMKEGQEQLGLVQRQSTIAGFYKGEVSVMESLEQQAGSASKRALTARAAVASLAVSSGTVIDDV